MAYREPLPPDCPPDDAVEITWRRIVYRLVRHNPPVDGDFMSQRAERPQRTFPVPECQVRGVSVFDNLQVATEWSKTRNLRGRQVCRVTLTQGAGRILKTSGEAHYTWWPLADFDILANCGMQL